MSTAGREDEPTRTAFSARRIVELLADLARGAEQAGGADALEVAQEIQAALIAQLEGNLGHVVLWEQFLRTPDEVADAAVGVVEGLMRRDPLLDRWLHEAWRRWCRATRDGDQASRQRSGCGEDATTEEVG